MLPICEQARVGANKNNYLNYCFLLVEEARGKKFLDQVMGWWVGGGIKEITAMDTTGCTYLLFIISDGFF